MSLLLSFRCLRTTRPLQAASHLHRASITSSCSHNLKNLPPRPKPPPDSEIEESYLKGSGPGGQKIVGLILRLFAAIPPPLNLKQNKTNSAVQIKHIPTGIVVKSQATRSREQNRKHARELLAQKLDDLKNGEQSRSAIVGDVKKKRSDSAAKKSRRKYRKLEEEKAAAVAEENGLEISEQTADAAQTAHSPSLDEGSARTGSNS